MTVNVSVEGAPVTNVHRQSFARIAPGSFCGTQHNALRAVFASLQGDARYVTEGVADLDALGEITALSDHRRALAVNALRVYGPSSGALRPFVDAAADAIENG